MSIPLPDIARCILGTVQLGLPYGIANEVGQPSQTVATRIVSEALKGGIQYFDTAQAYGTSEAALGEALRECDVQRKARIITKLPPIFPDSVQSLHDTLGQSLRNLEVASLYCLMLHREEQLPLLDGDIATTLKTIKNSGVAQHIGISVYTPQAAIAALKHELISVVQIPASLFDRRFEVARVFELAEKQNKELHVRSIFLQGVLCMEAPHLPNYLQGLSPALNVLRKHCMNYGVAPAQAALAFVLTHYPQSLILFGAETPTQVQKNIGYIGGIAHLSADFISGLTTIIPPQDVALLNPALWK